MATHNGESFIREQIDSILPQLKKNDELVISDDRSIDSTLRILSNYKTQLKILPSKEFSDPSKNFEYALTQCKNEIIFLADQDDVWRSNKIEVMTAALDDSDLVICDCRVVDADLKTIEPSFFSLNRSKKGLMNNFYKSSFVGCCMAFHRKILEKAIPFPDGVMHDHWIGLIAQKYFRVKFLPQILVDLRRHSKNYSTTGGTSKNSLRKKVVSRVKLAKMLLQR
jgi:glycosyltransferase involved in cell wall biosynthesis